MHTRAHARAHTHTYTYALTHQGEKAARDYSQQLDGYKGDAPLAHSILHKGFLAKETLRYALQEP